MCNNINCKDKKHISAINEMYGTIMNSLVSAGNEVFDMKSSGKCKSVPGWNDYVKITHEEAREAFLMWRVHKPRQGPMFNLMKTTKARFKYALRYCKSVE